MNTLSGFINFFNLRYMKKRFKKTKEFLSSIPEWENDYKKSNDLQITFKKEDWKSAKADFSNHDLKIFGYSVMEDWETPYMEALANIVTANGGTILELGYGMGISAGFIQKHDIKKHIIIEANKDVVKKAIEFKKRAKHKVEILEGFWEDVIGKVPDESVDGILFDTYPLTEEEIYQTQFFFFDVAYRKLKKGGIFTYYASEKEKFGKVHINKLKKAGFKEKNIKGRVLEVNPPKDCEYWKDKTILCPIIIK